jgi:hypothetical protein
VGSRARHLEAKYKSTFYVTAINVKENQANLQLSYNHIKIKYNAETELLTRYGSFTEINVANKERKIRHFYQRIQTALFHVYI